MNLYLATVQRIHLVNGMIEMTIYAYAHSPQQAGKLIKDNWPYWTMAGKFTKVNRAVAIVPQGELHEVLHDR